MKIKKTNPEQLIRWFILRSYRRCSRVIFICLTISFVAVWVESQIHVYPDRESSHILSIVKNSPDPSIDIETDSGTGKTTLVTNRNKTFKAYVLCVPPTKEADSCGERVYFSDISTGATYMVTGEGNDTESARPVDSLKWLDNGRLSYERWEGPHFGHRYTIDVNLKKQIAAYALSDQPK